MFAIFCNFSHGRVVSACWTVSHIMDYHIYFKVIVQHVTVIMDNHIYFNVIVQDVTLINMQPSLYIRLLYAWRCFLRAPHTPIPLTCSSICTCSQQLH